MSFTGKNQPKPEKITEINIYNGRETAPLIRELSPDKNEIVAHAIRKGGYAHERMFQNKMIDEEMHKAGERFRQDFERGHLRGYFAKLDMLRSGGGRENLTDGIMAAREKATRALGALGAKRDGSASLSASCVWLVVGEGETLETWSRRLNWGGRGMVTTKASGILIAALERLAFHYGYLDSREIKERSASRGFADGIRCAVTFLNLSAGTTDTPEAAALRKAASDLHKRYTKSQE